MLPFGFSGLLSALLVLLEAVGSVRVDLAFGEEVRATAGWKMVVSTRALLVCHA